MSFRQRVAWHNHSRNQHCDPIRVYRPETLDEVVAIVHEAERLSCEVRAIGSGHAWSDAALTPGFMMETHALNRILPLEPELFRAGTEIAGLVRTEAGIRLLELNAWLDQQDLALTNMGGYDHQTVAGVMSTATHGSGIELGPICDYARSIDMVTSGGAVYRIEPAAGLTNPTAFAKRYPTRRLVQDDQWFRAAKVGVGCLGVIYAVLLQVEPKYWLKECRKLSTWGEVKRDLQQGDVLQRHRHYEVYFNPYPGGDASRCLVTTRDRIDPPTGKPKDKLERNPLIELGGEIPLVAKLLHFLFEKFPKITPDMIDRGLAGLVDDEYCNVSYKVLNIGTANNLPAYSAEIGVPVDAAGRHIAAVERVMQIADKEARLGEHYHTAPTALRFVKASDASLAMMHGRNTMMIELILMNGTDGGDELIRTHEDALYALSGRPHWGQLNYLSGGPSFLRAMYPEFDRWQEVHTELNASGVFDSPMSKRVGISMKPFVP